MGLKDLFAKGELGKTLVNTTMQDLVDNNDVESANFVRAFSTKKERIIPDIDYSDPAKFAFYGSGEKYYEKSFDYIQQFYPYDGSKAEKLSWENSSSFLDLWIYENVYPRYTGHVSLNATDTSTATVFNSVIYESTTPQYVFFRGGPNPDPYGEYKYPLSPASASAEDFLSKANIYDTATNRDSNLKLDFSTGMTVEFWMKKEGWSDQIATARETFCHIRPTGSSVASPGGALWVYAAETSPAVVSIDIYSGSVDCAHHLNTGLTTIADGAWHHYAVVVETSGSDFNVSLYVDGEYVVKSTDSAVFSEVTGALVGAVGALATECWNGSAFGAAGGWAASVSSSFDEFRYWKTPRTAKEIGRHWFTTVGGGTNTDDANTNLGVYYRFNEGITQTASFDSTALDYSGRISNGIIYNYESSVRSTDSALSSSGYFEKKDPVIYSFHPSLLTTKDEYQKKGRAYDTNNNSAFINFVPDWILSEEGRKGGNLTRDFAQVVAFYFDELHAQITDFKDLKQMEYPSGSSLSGALPKPNKLARYILSDYGFEAPELFTAATYFEGLNSQNDEAAFQEKLEDLRNFVYQNIYKNLQVIYKSKGTERSINNLLRTVGIDQDLIKINVYADGLDYELKQNYKVDSSRVKAVDFNKVDRFAGTVYQYSSSIQDNVSSWVTGGLGSRDFVGSTYEAEVVFPRKAPISSKVYRIDGYPHLSASLFGAYAISRTAATQNDLVWAMTDGSMDSDMYFNFQLYAVRDAANSTNARIVLSASQDSAGSWITNELSSSVIKDLYSDRHWALAVRFRPKKWPLSDFVTGTLPGTEWEYNIYGATAEYDTIDQSFSVTGTIYGAPRTIDDTTAIYAGARRTNFSGTLLNPTDVKILSTRVYQTYLDNDVLNEHARDVSNFGTKVPSFNVNQFANTASLANIEIPSLESCILHWSFNEITGSDANGRFLVYDESSGSAQLSGSRYGWYGGRRYTAYPGRGDFFPANDPSVIDVDYISNAKQQLPEVINSTEMVQVRDRDDMLFTKNTRPVEYFFSVEKSMYQVISQEIIDLFAGLKDFNNLYGQPYNRYRQEYKALEHIRQLVFERYGSVADIEKFTNYYKWFDNALIRMIENLAPATARFSKKVGNMVESHILERNKYWNKFPTLEHKFKDPEGSIKGYDELNYNWEFGHAPLSPNQSTNQNESCLWWKDRVKRSGVVLTSGDSAVDSDKEQIRQVIVTDVSGAGVTLATVDGTKYAGRVYSERALSRHMRFRVDDLMKPERVDMTSFNKKETFWHSRLRRLGDDEYIEIRQHSFISSSVCSDEPAPPRKVKYFFDVYHPSTPTAVGAINSDIKGNYAVPFTLYSGSTTGKEGYEQFVQSWGVKEGLEINNLHNDFVEKNLGFETMMQGPFTERWVGGNQYRHVPLNAMSNGSLDTLYTRPEGFFLSGGAHTDGTGENVIRLEGNGWLGGGADPQALYTREPVAKRPVNIANIQVTGTAKNVTQIGNYEKRYQYFNTSGRNVQRRWLRNHSDEVASTTPMRWTGDYPLLTPFAAVGVTTADADVIGGSYYALQAPGISGVKPFMWIDGGPYGTGDLSLGYCVAQISGVGSSSANYAAEMKLAIESPNGMAGNVAVTRNGSTLTVSQRNGRDYTLFVGGESGTGFSITSLTGGIMGPDVFSLPDRSYLSGTVRNQTVIAERFSSPGGYETLSRGWLDPATETFSVYNALPFRNRGAVNELNNKCRTFTAQFGFQGRKHLTGNIAAVIDGVAPRWTGGAFTSSVDLAIAGSYPIQSASFHKVHRNTSYRPKYTGEDTSAADLSTITEVGAVFDNCFVSHAIPASDRQYAWITASLESFALGVSAPYGYATGSSEITFLSASVYGIGLDERPTVVFPVYPSVNNTNRRVYLGGGGPGVLDAVFSWAGVASAFGPGTTYIYNDFAQLNYAALKTVNTSSNTLTFSLNEMIGVAGNPFVDPALPQVSALLSATGSLGSEGASVKLLEDAMSLNTFLTNLNGPYGYPSWRQIRGGWHPVSRKEVENNAISRVTKVQVGTDKEGKPVYDSLLQKYTEPPLQNNVPVSLDLVVNKQNCTIAYPVQNTLRWFANYRLNEALISPDLYIEFATNSLYKNLLRGYTTENLGFMKFNSILFGQPLYPRQCNTYLAETRGRTEFDTRWNYARKDRTLDRSYNSLGNLAQNNSEWKLDALANFVTAEPGERTVAGVSLSPFRIQCLEGAAPQDFCTSRATGGYGEYQQPSAIYHNGDVWHNLTASVIYNRPVPEIYYDDGPFYIAGGGTMWEAGAQAKKPDAGPSYTSYENYAADLRGIGKAYSIVPEFRISEHMDYYLINSKEPGNFLVPNAAYLSLTGTAISSSGRVGINQPSTAFYNTYSTSDFLKMFKIIKDDHKTLSGVGPKGIQLECRALMKFLPYDGFYPAQRTAQLATLFSQSYGNVSKLTRYHPGVFGDYENLLSTPTASAAFRTLITPFFAPGIMYNSIKSGIAVDYPIHTGAFEVTGSELLQYRTISSNPNIKQVGKLTDAGLPRNKTNYSYRVPFEALVEPERILGTLIHDAEPHLSAALNCTASIAGTGDPRYTMAMSNFLAESVNFFLKDGKLSSLKSAPDLRTDNGAAFVVKAQSPSGDVPKHYTMRIVLSNAENQTLESLNSLLDSQFATVMSGTSLAWNPPLVNNYARTFGETNVFSGSSARQYYYGSSFGPPSEIEKIWESGGAAYPFYTASWAPFTPPYYNGYSHIQVTFAPTYTGYHDLASIKQACTYEVSRSVDVYGGQSPTTTTATQPAGVAFESAMQLSASLNFDQVVPYAQSADPTDPNFRWVIEPKFETPILDFSDASVTLPLVGSGSVSKGMWHQYGTQPSNPYKGLWLQVQDVPGNTEGGGPTGSLRSLLGFSSKAVQLGKPRSHKTIKEAVVAIPYTLSQGGLREFYTIDDAWVSIFRDILRGGGTPAVGPKTEELKKALNGNPAHSIANMLVKMKDYVFPPQFDFLRMWEGNEPAVQPIAMYIFPFEHKLTQEDITDMWQNLPPDSLLRIKEPKESRAIVSHPLVLGELLDNDMGTQTQWLVFKVKERARKNYFRLTSGIDDESRGMFNLAQKFNPAWGPSIWESVSSIDVTNTQDLGTEIYEPLFSYNWPYDFFSMVELVQMSGKINISSS